MKTNRSLFVFFLLFVLCGCNTISSKESIYSKTLREFANENKKANLKAVSEAVIIPNEGCGGCINSATIFLLKILTSTMIQLLLFLPG